MFKKKIRKIASFFMLLCMTASIAGCAGKEQPKEVVNTFMSSLQQYNIAKPMMLMVQSENGSSGVKDNGDFSKVDFNDKTTNDYLKAMLTNIEYKIVSEEQQGKDATVKTEVKTVDVQALMKNVMAQKAKEEQEKIKELAKTNPEAAKKAAEEAKAKQPAAPSASSQKDMSKMSDKELKEMEKTIADAVNNSKDLPKKTSIIEVKLEKEKGEWKVKPTDKLMKVIFGGQ